ncbi:MAG: flagellin [Dehalococcoidia bacterium]|nr:flagellin [Dehalococcoidia bacterium]
MIINTNVMAINAQRNLNVTGAKMGKALERLSSGLRINRTADDAAGLAISEKMRAQVRGMQQGLRNAQDGVSMIQTAEGALSETHAILQRMRELTVQAGSSTLSSSDREAIGEELLTLRNEVDNIASRTRFNGLNLLTGSLSVTAAGTMTTATVDDGGGDEVTVTVDASGADPLHTFTVSGTGADLTITNSTTNVAQTITVEDFTADGESQVLNFDALGIKVNLEVSAFNDGITGAKLVDTGTNPLKSSALTLTGDGSASFRVGSEATDNVTVAFSDLRSSALGSGGVENLDDLVTDNQAVSTITKADDLLAAIDSAVDQVSTQRAKLGAAQNQMESAINSLGVAVENLSASESRVRDADIAAVSSELVTRQIMQQAGIAVLSQANTAPQSVLQLLG